MRPILILALVLVGCTTAQRIPDSDRHVLNCRQTQTDSHIEIICDGTPDRMALIQGVGGDQKMIIITRGSHD
jgi:hypothetical protein